MTDQQLLHLIYGLEKPILQKNAWPDLRIRIADVITAAAALPATRAQVLKGLRALRLEGQLMFLPDWEQWEKPDSEDEQLLDSPTQWEPVESAGELPAWERRKVFMPEEDELDQWFVRSRVAETARLLFANRERFGLEASTSHLAYELQPRFRPDRDAYSMAKAIGEVQAFVDGLTLSQKESADTLKLAIQITGEGLGHSKIAAFQVRAWRSVLRSLFEEPRQIDATMITAGVSSGKTFSFLLPLLTLLVYRALRGQGGRNRALIIYPRTSLVEDQYQGLSKVLKRINAQLSAHGKELTDHPALDAGQMLGESLGQGAGGLAESFQQVRQQKIEVILTTSESLKNRMLHPGAVRTFLEHVEVIVFDEIHLMEGLSGCHGIYFVRRLRQLIRNLRGNPDFEPAWIGASATVAEPVAHAARVLTLEEQRIQHVTPAANELTRFGTFHHIFLHTRAGKASISAVTNGVSCLVHTRNNGTAHAHYEDPSKPVLKPRRTENILKTIVFVDSLSTIGRLHFTTADNERTYNPQDTTPPYYSWFYRPAARFGATATEQKAIKSLQAVRDWCQKCYHGVPARLSRSAFQTNLNEFSFLRTHSRMDEKAKKRATPPGFREKLERLPETVSNLDGCPFHEARLCWWFSQDNGQQRKLGAATVRIDQNRAIAYTSKTEAPELHEDVNDYFLTDSRQVWIRAGGIPDQPEVVSTMLASPRIEVGVDFKNVRDGATHKAMRSASAFQQKIGRVGREDESDSIIVTFLAHRPTDAHFAHHPARLIDAAHLDPIPLKSDNPDVLRSHLFAAALEFIASRPRGQIPNEGHELNIIGPGTSQVPASWEGKVRGCIDFLTLRRKEVLTYMLAATGQREDMSAVAEKALDHLLVILDLFVTDLGGAYTVGQTAAHWFKENQPPQYNPPFVQLLDTLTAITEGLQSMPGTLPPTLQSAIDALLKELTKISPDAKAIAQAQQVATTTMMPLIVSQVLTLAVAGPLMTQLGQVSNIVTALGSLSLKAPMDRVRKAYGFVQAFFEESDPSTRRMQQYYLHDLLTRLPPFRQFYPFGLVRTHFQHVNAREVTVFLPGQPSESESLSTALYELLPGTWNYRWVRPLKSSSGAIDQSAGTGESYIYLSNIERVGGAMFERTPAPPLDPSELPADMPVVATGLKVPILRPVRLRLDISRNQPEALLAERLIADGDEAPRSNDPTLVSYCPTLPRAFPATWYRIAPAPAAVPVIAKAAPNTPDELPHTFPASGRVLLEGVTFSTRLKIDRYVYAIDRSYGTVVESPRLHYRHGPGKDPVVLGNTMEQTDGLTFRLRSDTLNEVVEAALGSAGPLLGELTARALRRFISRTTGCSPFQSEMLRKVLLMGFLDQGNTLSMLDCNAIHHVLTGLTSQEYDRLSRTIIDGIFAGAVPAEVSTVRSRQTSWYNDAWPTMLRIQNRANDFNGAFVESVARDILVHTLAVTALDGLSRLVGASDGDLSYFHQAERNELYIFDSVEGGNGCAETAGRYLQVPPLQRLLNMNQAAASALPSSDGFMLIEETMASCPAQTTARLLFAACKQGVKDAAQLRFPPGLATDLEARMRHEYDPVVGAYAIVDSLVGAQSQLFSDWQDLLWLQLVPERFAAALVQQNVCAGTDNLRARTHLCISGCLECVNNGDGSIYGSLTSHEHVSKNLLELLRRHVATSEPGAFLEIHSSTPEDVARKAEANRPVLDASGKPVKVTLKTKGKAQQVALNQKLSTVSPDLGLVGKVPLLTSAGKGAWDVNIPFLASYRDERPLP